MSIIDVCLGTAIHSLRIVGETVTLSLGALDAAESNVFEEPNLSNSVRGCFYAVCVTGRGTKSSGR